MQEYNQKLPLCNCVDWKKDDLVLRVNHLMTHFEFRHFQLEYSTLEAEENRRLCKVGRCRTCGQRLCIGTELPAQATVNDLLNEIYRWMFQTWDGTHESLPDGANCFRDMFLSLFHESDRDLVSNWINQRGLSTQEGD